MRGNRSHGRCESTLEFMPEPRYYTSHDDRSRGCILLAIIVGCVAFPLGVMTIGVLVRAFYGD